MMDFNRVVEETHPAFEAWGMSTEDLSDVLSALQFLQIKIIASRSIDLDDAVLILLIGADLLHQQDTDEVIAKALDKIRTMGHVADVIAMKNKGEEQ